MCGGGGQAKRPALGAEQMIERGLPTLVARDPTRFAAYGLPQQRTIERTIPGETQTFQAPWHARLGQYVPPGYSVVGESHAEGDPGRLMATGDIAGWRDIGGGQYTRMTPERTVTETVAGTEPAAVEGLLRTDPGFREAVSHAFIPSAPTFQRNPLLEALMGQRFARMGQSLLGDLLQRRF